MRTILIAAALVLAGSLTLAAEQPEIAIDDSVPDDLVHVDPYGYPVPLSISVSLTGTAIETIQSGGCNLKITYEIKEANIGYREVWNIRCAQ